MRFPQGIQQLDEQVFRVINRSWANSFFDTVLIPARGELFWLPLYILIAVLLVYYFRSKSIYLILLLGLNFACTDQLSSAVVKPTVGRIRPCNDEQFKDEVILRIDACGYGKSFTSSHATNTFAFAMMLSLLFGKKNKWLPPLAFFWAFLISYAQIYVGVHYPLDIFGGALLGILISLILFSIARKYLFPKIKFSIYA